MIPFHDTLERFFRKNFPEEIRRLSMDASPITPPISPSARYLPRGQGSLLHLHERNHSEVSNVTNTTMPSKNFYIPPLQLGRPVVTPPPASPVSIRTQTAADGVSGSNPGSGVASSAASAHTLALAVPYSKQTPLQRNLAHLARHGFPGVTVGPGPGTESGTGFMGGSGSLSAGSPQGSFVNVGSTLPGTSTIASGAASVVTSGMTSIGSLKGRFSRLGSLNFGKHGRDG